jgi:hypothetical protein
VGEPGQRWCSGQAPAADDVDLRLAGLMTAPVPR